MKEHPILFNCFMVRAILEGRKTQTRRVINPQPNLCDVGFYAPINIQVAYHKKYNGLKCTYGQPGDVVWVKEQHFQYGHWEPVETKRTRTGRMKWRFVDDKHEALYEAPEIYRKGRHHKDPYTPAWHLRNSLFMPRWASRIMLEIVSVRVERLQDISTDDCYAEGHQTIYDMPKNVSDEAARDWYMDLWQKINGKESWDANPWVWVLEFKRVEA